VALETGAQRLEMNNIMLVRILGYWVALTVVFAGCKHEDSAARVDTADKKLTASTATQGPKTGMFAGKPYVTLRIQAESMPFQVHVNDAPVSYSQTGGPADETYPINQFLNAWGDNVFSILAIPWTQADDTHRFDEPAFIKVTVLVQEAGALDKPGVAIGTLAFRGKHGNTPQALEESSSAGTFDSAKQLAESSRGDVVVGQPHIRRFTSAETLIASRTIAMPMPLPQWEFLRSDKIVFDLDIDRPSDVELYEQVLAAYEVVWKGLKAGQVDAILSLFEERSRNNDAAFYLPPGTSQAKLKALLEEACHDPGLQLRALHREEPWTLDVGPGQRTVRFMTGPQGSAALRFTDDVGLSTALPITFRKQGERFIIAL
jgi:hypothetical protein